MVRPHHHHTRRGNATQKMLLPRLRGCPHMTSVKFGVFQIRPNPPSSSSATVSMWLSPPSPLESVIVRIWEPPHAPTADITSGQRLFSLPFHYWPLLIQRTILGIFHCAFLISRRQLILMFKDYFPNQYFPI